MEDNKHMIIIQPESQQTLTAPIEHFTGTVHLTPLIKGEEPSCLACASVSFEPSARSAWHTHPRGQLLIVTDGKGFIQEWGMPMQTIEKGDIIWTPPAIKHWHGATPHTSMTHTAIQESLQGNNVEWLEKVTEDEYRAG